MYLIFDTETTGLPKKWKAPLTDSDNWPRCVQIAWQLHESNGDCVSHENFIVKPDAYDIPYDSEKIHGISTALAEDDGIDLIDVLKSFEVALKKAKFICGHNVSFDLNIIGAEFLRLGFDNLFEGIPIIDTCTEETASLCKISGGRGGKFKLPTLIELNKFLFNDSFDEAHNATADVEATTRCLFELIRNESIAPNAFNGETSYYRSVQDNFKSSMRPIGLIHVNLKKASEALIKEEVSSGIEIISNDTKVELLETPFVHLHVHSQFSVLQSTSQIPKLVEAAQKNNMPALALTDKANLMGAFHFIKAVKNHNSLLEDKTKEIKPIVGCEFYVCENHKDKTRRDDGYQVVFLAKNKNGYHNLSKMSSLAYTSGFYYVPRIDREIVEQYKENLIILTGNLYGEIPSKILITILYIKMKTNFLVEFLEINC